MTATRRIALAHLAPRCGALDENRALIERATVQAARARADWVISGELVVTGYQFADKIGTAWIEPQPDRWLRRYAKLAADLGVAAFVCQPELDGRTGLLHTTMLAVDRDGAVVGRHRKLWPTPGSEDWSAGSTALRITVVDGVKVGMLICADAYRPEPAAELRRLGAEVLVSAAAWWPGEWGPDGEWETRSLETGLPVVVCNRTGLEPSYDLRNSESVIAYDGRRVVCESAPDSVVVLTDCTFGPDGLTAGKPDVVPVAA
jgi:5-aminopentanamidase